MRSTAKSTLWSTLLFALLGLAWCGYMAFPTATPPPCATSGCALFRDTKFAGLSLWAVGGAYFFLLAVLCLRGNRALARALALLALVLDALLLLIMFLTAPCFDCLVAAVFIGLCYYTLQSGGDGWFQEQSGPSVLLPVWVGLFLGNAVLAGNEMLPMHSMGGQDKAEVRVFFSPSCPACREALIAFGDKAALLPVLERGGDMDAIMRLEAYLAAKVPMKEALSRCMDPDEPVPDPGLLRQLILDLQLLRNKAALMRQGFRALPLIQINGMPGQKNTSLEKNGGLLRNGHAAQAPASQAAPGTASGAAPAPAGPNASGNGGPGAPGADAPGHDTPDGAAGPGAAPWNSTDPQASGPQVSGDGVSGNGPSGNDALGRDGLPDFLDAGGLQKCGGDSPQPCE